jgi:hypothetical protein
VPASPAARVARERKARTVAAHRERWAGPGPILLHPVEECRTLEQRMEWGRTRRALDACRRLSQAERGRGCAGARAHADLSTGKEWARVVVEGRLTRFHGPDVAPLAVALVWKLHGAVALLEHPGLVSLRVQLKPRRAPGPMLALPPHDELEDLLRGL